MARKLKLLEGRILFIEAIGFGMALRGVTSTQIEEDIRLALWPGYTDRTQKAYMIDYKSGKRNSLAPWQVVQVCELTGIDPNTLFGYDGQ